MALYLFGLIIGLGLFIFTYALNFDSLSEEELVRQSYYWLLPFLFGLFGLFLNGLNKKVDQGEYGTVRQALVGSSKSYGLFGPLIQVIFFPVIFINIRNTPAMAVLGALIWGFLLFLFNLFVFPQL